MHQQVAQRKADIGSQRSGLKNNIFSMLVEASEKEEGKFKLDDSELIGNVFIMLLAGHETTAHSLAATLAFMAANPEIQEEVYQQVISVVGQDREPGFDDYAKLNKVLSAFLESLRMFPPAYLLVRGAFEDTVLKIPNSLTDDGTKIIPVAKGTEIIIDIVGLQYNPRYYDNPEEYRPSRWYDVAHESDAMSAFNIGPRACLGRKFATTEAVAFLTVLLRDYRLEPLLRAKETEVQWRERVLDAMIELTLGVGDVPVSFVRRTAS